MSKLEPKIMRRTSICTAVGIAVTMGMVLMPFLVKPVMADDEAAVCDPETVAAPDGSSAEYTYKLDSDCTLHIGPVSLPSREVDGIEIYPIQQHDKVRRIVFDKPEQTSLNVNSSYLFYDYPKVESIEGVDKLDVSHVMQFENAFAGLNLKEPVDFSSWDISKAWNFQSMFERSNLDGFKGLGKFTFDLNRNVQWNARNFNSMFADTTSTEDVDLSGWTFLHPRESNGVLFNSMFKNARTPRIDVSSLSDLNIGTGAMSMFANTNTDIEGLDKFPAQTMTDSSRMFENARPTNQIDLSSWDTTHLKVAYRMFSGSDIEKFKGMNKWNLESLGVAVGMYENLHPSSQVRIPTNFPNLQEGSMMFAGSDLDMLPDIGKLQLSDQSFSPGSLTRMFENSKATYVKMSDWKNVGYFINGMLASPNIKYTTFGNKTVGNDYDNDFVLRKASTLFEGLIDASDSSINVWDRPDLPSKYAAKKWAVLPIKQECEFKLNEDNNPDDLPKNCWDNSQFWVSDKTGKDADEELLDNTTKHYQRIFFRLETIPVNFNANGIENATSMPNMNHLVLPSSTGEDMIPDTTPKDPSGVKVFDSWNTQADGKGKTYRPGDRAGYNSDSLDLYAQWKDKVPNVQFNNNGGEGPTPETKPAPDDNTKIAVDCTSTPSKNGSTFIGWSKTKNDVLEGSDAGEKGNIDVCGYSDKKIVKGLAGRTIDLYATWAKRPQAFFKENRPKDMTALLPATKTITGNWSVDDSTPKTYVAPNIEGWNKGYSPDGVYRFDGWMNEDGSPFTGAYLERNDLIINAKWSRIVPAENHNHDNDNNDQNNHDNGNTNDNSGNTTGDDSNTNHENNKETADNSNSDSDTTNSQQKNNAVNKPGTIPVTNNSNNQLNDSSSLFDPTPESPLNDSGESSNGSGSGYVASSNTDSPSSQSADSDNASSGHNLAETGASIIAPIVLIIVSIASATAAMVFSRMRNRRQQ